MIRVKIHITTFHKLHVEYYRNEKLINDARASTHQ